MQWAALFFVTAFALSRVEGVLRFPCSQLVTERFDPLIEPGKVSAHLHQIVGGNAFNLTMHPDNDLPTLSTCTTCKFKEDFSNYWTAVMFFKHKNGSYIRVPQMANAFVGAPDGGMTVYYIQPYNGESTTSFKKGFRMIVGDPAIRNRTFVDPASAEYRALSFRCFQANFSGPAAPYAPGAGLDTFDFPKEKCSGGIRANIYFPSCWDGERLDTPNHHDHMAYPVGTPDEADLIFFNGTCPSTHPVRMPVLFMETIWDTRPFNDLEWPEDGQPFVFSMGDPTGFGQHADYVFGWKDDSLQRAMDVCDTWQYASPENCKELTLNSDDEMNSCFQQPKIDEVTEGKYIDALPGCNPIQDGPGPATMVHECNAATTTVSFAAPTAVD